MKILSRFDGRTCYEDDADSMLKTLQAGVKARADLTEADLTEANLNWNSHWLIGHILKVAAGDDVARRCLAGGIIISADWCWDKMLSFDHPEKAWALSVLLPLIMVGDNAPEALRALKSKGETK